MVTTTKDSLSEEKIVYLIEVENADGHGTSFFIEDAILTRDLNSKHGEWVLQNYTLNYWNGEEVANIKIYDEDWVKDEITQYLKTTNDFNEEDYIL